MSPLLRSVAVGVVEALGEAALPAWRDMAAARRVGPHARAVLAGWDQGPEPSEADWEWLGVEAAAAAQQLPPELADADTIGIIYDETDGLNFYNAYGMLRDLFADPVLAADKRYADVLRGYLRSETIAPLLEHQGPKCRGVECRFGEHLKCDPVQVRLLSPAKVKPLLRCSVLTISWSIPTIRKRSRTKPPNG